MTIAECYAELGADYNEVFTRLRREAIISKLAIKFLDDQSFNLLTDSLKNNDIDEAYRGAHTLKGICQNLSFTELYHPSNELAEALRAKDINKAEQLLVIVTDCYEKTVRILNNYKNSLQ